MQIPKSFLACSAVFTILALVSAADPPECETGFDSKTLGSDALSLTIPSKGKDVQYKCSNKLNVGTNKDAMVKCTGKMTFGSTLYVGKYHVTCQQAECTACHAAYVKQDSSITFCTGVLSPSEDLSCTLSTGNSTSGNDTASPETKAEGKKVKDQIITDYDKDFKPIVDAAPAVKIPVGSPSKDYTFDQPALTEGSAELPARMRMSEGRESLKFCVKGKLAGSFNSGSISGKYSYIVEKLKIKAEVMHNKRMNGSYTLKKLEMCVKESISKLEVTCAGDAAAKKQCEDAIPALGEAKNVFQPLATKLFESMKDKLFKKVMEKMGGGATGANETQANSTAMNADAKKVKDAIIRDYDADFKPIITGAADRALVIGKTAYAFKKFALATGSAMDPPQIKGDATKGYYVKYCVKGKYSGEFTGSGAGEGTFSYNVEQLKIKAEVMKKTDGYELKKLTLCAKEAISKLEVTCKGADAAAKKLCEDNIPLMGEDEKVFKVLAAAFFDQLNPELVKKVQAKIKAEVPKPSL